MPNANREGAFVNAYEDSTMRRCFVIFAGDDRDVGMNTLHQHLPEGLESVFLPQSSGPLLVQIGLNNLQVALQIAPPLLIPKIAF